MNWPVFLIVVGWGLFLLTFPFVFEDEGKKAAIIFISAVLCLATGAALL